MEDTVHLYSFGDFDRSGKVRWTAAELGLSVEEHRVSVPGHRKPPYLELNPYGHIPTVRFREHTLLESTAICWALVDAVRDPDLDVARGEPGRQDFHFWMSLFTEGFEARLVECAVSKSGILPPEYFTLHEKSLRRKLAIAASHLPHGDYLCGAKFTLADICAGYSLRLAVQCGLIQSDRASDYLERLRGRAGAQKSRVFETLE